jgi:hypothetical protein
MIRFFILLGSLIGVAETSFSQPSAPVLFQAKSTTSEKSINIPGTRIYINPPDKFVVSKTFTGLQNGRSVIEVFDLVGGNIDVIAEDFTVLKFEQQGITVLDFDEVNVNGFRGRIISLQNEPDQKSFTLVFGDASFSVIVIANYPASNALLGEAIRESILSLAYDKTNTFDPMSAAAFRIDEARSAFRYKKKSANTFYYEKPSTDAGYSPYVTVTQLAWDYTTTPSMIGELMLREMKKYGLVNPDIKKQSKKSINGYPAYESEIYATREGEKCMIYQMVMVHNAQAIIVHGIGKKDFRKTKDEFKKLAYTIKFK